MDGKLDKRKIKEYFVDGIDEQEIDVVKNLWKLVIGRALEECVNRCKFSAYFLRIYLK